MARVSAVEVHTAFCWPSPVVQVVKNLPAMQEV